MYKKNITPPTEADKAKPVKYDLFDRIEGCNFTKHTITPRELHMRVTNPSNIPQQLQIQQVKAKGTKDDYKEAKKQLNCIIVQYSGGTRSVSPSSVFTGAMFIDLDIKDNIGLDVNHLFNEIAGQYGDNIYNMYKSSGGGLHIIIRTTASSKEEYISIATHLIEHFEKEYSIKIDPASKKCTQVAYLPYYSDISHVNPRAKPLELLNSGMPAMNRSKIIASNNPRIPYADYLELLQYLSTAYIDCGINIADLKSLTDATYCLYHDKEGIKDVYIEIVSKLEAIANSSDNTIADTVMRGIEWIEKQNFNNYSREYHIRSNALLSIMAALRENPAVAREYAYRYWACLIDSTGSSRDYNEGAKLIEHYIHTPHNNADFVLRELDSIGFKYKPGKSVKPIVLELLDKRIDRMWNASVTRCHTGKYNATDADFDLKAFLCKVGFYEQYKPRSIRKIRIGRYVSERKDVLLAAIIDAIKNKTSFQLKANTGTGKSTVFVELRNELKDFCVCVVLPTVLMALQFSKKHNIPYLLGGDHKLGNLERQAVVASGFFVTNISALGESSQIPEHIKFDVVIFDESHHLVTHYLTDFKKPSIERYLKQQRAATTIYVSATPDLQFVAEMGIKTLEFIEDNPQRYNVYKYGFTTLGETTRIIAGEIAKGGVHLIRCNSKADCYKVKDALLAETMLSDEQFAIIHQQTATAAESEKNRHRSWHLDCYNSILETSRLPVITRVCIFTSILQEGIDLLNEDIMSYTVIDDLGTTTSQFDNVNVWQGAARARNVPELRVNVIIHTRREEYNFNSSIGFLLKGQKDYSSYIAKKFASKKQTHSAINTHKDIEGFVTRENTVDIIALCNSSRRKFYSYSSSNTLINDLCLDKRYSLAEWEDEDYQNAELKEDVVEFSNMIGQEVSTDCKARRVTHVYLLASDKVQYLSAIKHISDSKVVLDLLQLMGERMISKADCANYIQRIKEAGDLRGFQDSVQAMSNLIQDKLFTYKQAISILAYCVDSQKGIMQYFGAKYGSLFFALFRFIIEIGIDIERSNVFRPAVMHQLNKVYASLSGIVLGETYTSEQICKLVYPNGGGAKLSEKGLTISAMSVFNAMFVVKEKRIREAGGRERYYIPVAIKDLSWHTEDISDTSGSGKTEASVIVKACNIQPVDFVQWGERVIEAGAPIIEEGNWDYGIVDANDNPF